MKETKRKAFKFYRSYYDMFNELDKDKDKLEFIRAVLDKQFLGIDPKLKGIIKMAYVSQLHSIEKQVKGWQDATGQELTGAYEHPLEGGLTHPTQEEQVKEKEEEKEEVLTILPTPKGIDFDNLLKFINQTFGRSFRKINDSVKQKYKARIKEGYTSEDIREAIKNCKKTEYHIENNYKYCTPEFFSRAEKIDLHSSIGTPEKSSDPKTNVLPKSNYNPTG